MKCRILALVVVTVKKSLRIIFRKSRKSAPVDLGLDLESPMVKMIRLLEALENSKFPPILGWKKRMEEARSLKESILVLTRRPELLLAPEDLNGQLRDRFDTQDTSEDLVQFLLDCSTAFGPAEKEKPGHSESSRRCTTTSFDGDSDQLQRTQSGSFTPASEVESRIKRLISRRQVKQLVAWEEVTESFFIDYSVAHAKGNPVAVLMTTAMVALHRFDLFTLLDLDECQMRSYLTMMEDGYKENPYHSAFHAADVTARLAAILNATGIASYLIQQGQAIKLLAAVLAAVIHDYEHPGNTNQYAVHMGLDQAKIYNDRAVYENWSLYRALSLFEVEDPLNGHPSKAELRASIINYVMVTDMGQHFESVGSAQSALISAALMKPQDAEDGPGLDLSKLSPRNLDIVLMMAIKVADLGHTATPIDQHLHWVERLQQEFYHQGDLERANGIPISPLMDRTKNNGPCKGVNQVGFFEVIVIPLYQFWVDLFPTCSPLLEQLLANRKYWEENPGLPPTLDVEANPMAHSPLVPDVSLHSLLSKDPHLEERRLSHGQMRKSKSSLESLGLISLKTSEEAA
mmetsp:Transcript_22891/g.50208  ORF Transcript_22891/g.50208 Transcript_22891/m.50208 type:complete len:573 (-) Transcript_22891:275-1993(-)|eukprot:CAMPEP_0118943532 /NCGR_PEP_ID=MMETSP1169-20130426/38487_1 /TAXON_ID=36882 /ORGANISM="Pyramimonas obovata, Strain CCMP722" /LENGTH=572 /DNA_ID=CAMNT_0006888809 /DNA_START=240 /DNA_END=1958 /DNA_ORIENTATION=-